jgi:hypothetical protein
MEPQDNPSTLLFSQYKQALADGQEQEFWEAVILDVDQQSAEARLSQQQVVRANVDQILARMTQIQQQLTAASQLV